MEENKKYFLDLSGLAKLWSKIKDSFADKAKTEESIANIEADISSFDASIKLIDTDVSNIENTILSIAPKEVNYYKDAVETSKSMAPGTTIKVNKIETSEEDNTPSGFLTGIYIVVKSGEIEYLNTSTGDIDSSDISALTGRVESLESSVVKSAKIVDNNGATLEDCSIANNVLIISHDNTFDINSNSVRAITHRAVAAKFRDIEQSITQIPKFKVAVVDELPTEKISLYTIYLVRNQTSTDNNLFTEYIYVENIKDNPETTDIDESSYVWEKLGEQTLVVNDFITNSELNGILSSELAAYAKTADVNDLITQKTNNIVTEVLGTVETTYSTKAEVSEIAESIKTINTNIANFATKDEIANTYLTQADASNTYLSKIDANNKGWMNKTEIIDSITSTQDGEIGNAIAITDKQIEDMINNINNNQNN